MANITKPAGLSLIWANGGTKVDPGVSKYNIGWVVQLPPYEYQNFIDSRQDQAIAHMNQHGIAEWDTVTEYQGGLSYTQGSDGVIYKAKLTSVNKDPSNTLNNSFWTKAFEDFGSVATVSAALTAHITNYQTLAAIGNLPAARANLSVYSKVESDTRFASLNGNASQVFSVGPATQSQHAIQLGQINSLLVPATESTTGVIKIATSGVVETGADDSTAVSPLKAASVYLKKSGNLAGIANPSTARTNLGLGGIATMEASAFLSATNNLSDITSAATARANLGITSIATRSETFFLKTASNLSDLGSASAARTNLGLSDAATTPVSSFMLKSDNLSGLASQATSRDNLGLGTAAVLSQDAIVFRSNNLGDLANPQTARNNLGLGNMATRNIFGVDGDLNLTSSKTSKGYSYMGNGLIMQWGQGPALGDDTNVWVNFSVPMNALTIQLTGVGNAGSGVGPCFLTNGWTSAGFMAYNNYNSGDAKQFSWFAIGTV